VNILLDTNIFIWAMTEEARVPKQTKVKLAEESSKNYISQASIWEIQIKYDLGKLPLRTSVKQLIRDAIDIAGIAVLPIDTEAIYLLNKLPHIHRDPFDRLIIAHAMLHGWLVATTNPEFQKYPVRVID